MDTSTAPTLNVSNINDIAVDPTVKTSSEGLARGLTQFLTPIVSECEANITNVFASQIQLANQIDALNAGM